MRAHEEAAGILLRVLEALARQNRKTLSAATRADVARACELLTTGDDYSDLLEDLLERPTMPRVTQSFEKEDYGDPKFGKWRGQQRYSED